MIFFTNFSNDSEQVLFLPFFNFIDDFEPNSTLKSHSTTSKISGVYSTIPCFPDEIISKLSNIFMAMLFFVEDRKQFGFHRILPTFMDQLNYLSEQGIDAENLGPPNIKKIKLITCLFLGENLGLNQILGFVESFL